MSIAADPSIATDATPNAPAGAPERRPHPPRICTRLTALGGALRYCVVAYRALSYAEAKSAVRLALQQGWITEPPPACEAVIYTSIGAAGAALSASGETPGDTGMERVAGAALPASRETPGDAGVERVAGAALPARRSPPAPLGLERFIDPDPDDELVEPTPRQGEAPSAQ